MTSSIRKGVLLVLTAIALGASGYAVAQPRHAPSAHHGGGSYYGPHGGVRFGLYLGAPWVGGPWYGWPGYYGAPYYSPYYYPPAVVTVPVAPQTYVEQGPVDAPAPPATQAAPAAPQPGYWYYCADTRGYYPYVKECPAGWQRVSPQPPG